jgi:AcrR family transcriptional regulator
MPREEVIERLVPVFRDRGYNGASLSEISDATGLGKSSLYHHFPGGKEEMARAVISHIDAWLKEHALDPLKGHGSPQERIDRMIAALDRCYAGGKRACVLGNMVIDGIRNLFQEQLARSFTQWIEALRDVLVEAGIPAKEARDRAEDAVIRIEGALILAGGLGRPAPFRRILGHLPDDLLRAG